MKIYLNYSHTHTFCALYCKLYSDCVQYIQLVRKYCILAQITIMLVNYLFSPLLWPLNNIAQALSIKEPPPKSDIQDCPPYLTFSIHISVVIGAFRAFVMACGIIYWLSPIIQPAGRYPALGGAESFSMSWILPIVVTNVVSTWIICGFWDWFLYYSPLKETLRPFKMNPIYPSTEQVIHDAFWTTTATLMASALEIWCCYCYCNDIFPAFSHTLTWSDLGWALLITHWRVPHFYVVHRVMHPWKTSAIPDFGKVLYKHVHSLHHKSYNPTAFSGTSMHPVESLLYYSACFIPIPFGCHPSVVLGCLIDCAVGAWLGHDGFEFPGSGDLFHQLHHAHFDCNYGTSIIPLDYFFGTAAASKGDLRRIWGETAGRKNS